MKNVCSYQEFYNRYLFINIFVFLALLSYYDIINIMEYNDG